MSNQPEIPGDDKKAVSSAPTAPIPSIKLNYEEAPAQHAEVTPAPPPAAKFFEVTRVPPKPAPSFISEQSFTEEPGPRPHIKDIPSSNEASDIQPPIEIGKRLVEEPGPQAHLKDTTFSNKLLDIQPVIEEDTPGLISQKVNTFNSKAVHTMPVVEDDNIPGLTSQKVVTPGAMLLMEIKARTTELTNLHEEGRAPNTTNYPLLPHASSISPEGVATTKR